MSNLIPLVLAFSVLFTIFGITAVVLCLILRSRSHSGIRREEWVVTLAAIIGVAYSICHCLATKYDIGRHITDISLTSELQTKASKLTFVAAVLFGPIVTLAKISIVDAYLRRALLQTERFFYTFLLVFLMFYGAVATILQILQCQPVHAFWDHNIINKNCWPQEALNVALAAINSTTDLVVFFWPVVYLLRMDGAPLRRNAFLIQLILGVIVFIVGILRIWRITVYSHAADATYEQALVFVTSTVQLWLGIITACVSSLKLLFQKGSFYPHNAPKHRESTSKNMGGRFHRPRLSASRMFGANKLPKNEKGFGAPKIHIVKTVDMISERRSMKSFLSLPLRWNKSRDLLARKASFRAPSGTPNGERDVSTPRSPTLDRPQKRNAKLASKALPPHPGSMNTALSRLTDMPARSSTKSAALSYDYNGMISLPTIDIRDLNRSRNEEKRKADKPQVRDFGESSRRGADRPSSRVVGPTFYIQPGETKSADLWQVKAPDGSQSIEEAVSSLSSDGNSAVKEQAVSETSKRLRATSSPRRLSWLSENTLEFSGSSEMSG